MLQIYVHWQNKPLIIRKPQKTKRMLMKRRCAGNPLERKFTGVHRSEIDLTNPRHDITNPKKEERRDLTNPKSPRKA